MAANAKSGSSFPPIFISYSSSDLAIADDLHTRLTAAGFDVWFDRERLKPGFDWHREIEAACDEARIVLPVLTPNWRLSEWTRYETYGAEQIVPLWFQGEIADISPEPLRAKQAADLRNPDDAAWDALAAHLKDCLARSIPAPDQAKRIVSPKLPLRNPNFTGRTELLQDIETSLDSGAAVALTQAGKPVSVAGLGGVGKTQLASQYARIHLKQYRIVWWLPSEDLAALQSDLAQLASALELPEAGQADLAAAAQAALAYLSDCADWLLIFDNAQTVEAVSEYVPDSSGHVIITTRSQFSGEGLAHVLPVDTWPREESIAYLIKRLEKDDPDYGNLAEALGNLPLALAQAASFIERRKSSAGAYLQQFKERKLVLFSGKPPRGYHATVATTWSMAFEEVSKTPLAADLLNLCAFLAPEDIPLDLLAKWPPASDEDAREEAIALLQDYSLVTRTPDALSIHRLVQAVVRERLQKSGNADSFLKQAIDLVDTAYPGDLQTNTASWATCERLLPHGLSAVNQIAEKDDLAMHEAARLATTMGLYCRIRADYQQAKNLQVTALRIGEAAYGPDHPEVSSVANNLGRVLHDFGDLAGARENYERAIKIDEAVHGPNHPNVAIRVNNLGGVLRDLGDLGRAKANFERALKISEEAYGRDHPTVAIRVNNLGLVLRDMGDFAGARANFERAYDIFRQFLGEDHPNTKIARRHLESLPPGP